MLKSDDEWDVFLTHWLNSETGTYEKVKDLPYRKAGKSPFGEKPRIFPPVSTLYCFLETLLS